MDIRITGGGATTPPEGAGVSKSVEESFVSASHLPELPQESPSTESSIPSAILPQSWLSDIVDAKGHEDQIRTNFKQITGKEELPKEVLNRVENSLLSARSTGIDAKELHNYSLAAPIESSAAIVSAFFSAFRKEGE